MSRISKGQPQRRATFCLDDVQFEKQRGLAPRRRQGRTAQADTPGAVAALSAASAGLGAA